MRVYVFTAFSPQKEKVLRIQYLSVSLSDSELLSREYARSILRVLEGTRGSQIRFPLISADDVRNDSGRAKWLGSNLRSESRTRDGAELESCVMSRRLRDEGRRVDPASQEAADLIARS